MKTAIVGATYIDSHNWHYLRLAVYEAFKGDSFKKTASFKETAIVKSIQNFEFDRFRDFLYIEMPLDTQ